MQTFTVPEVAEILRVPKLHVYRLVREGKLPAIHVGRFVRISEDALRAWIGRGGAPLTSPQAFPASAPNPDGISA